MGIAKWIGLLALNPLAKALPPLDETERAALEAALGFEDQLFVGRSDIDGLMQVGPVRAGGRPGDGTARTAA